MDNDITAFHQRRDFKILTAKPQPMRAFWHIVGIAAVDAIEAVNFMP